MSRIVQCSRCKLEKPHRARGMCNSCSCRVYRQNNAKFREHLAKKQREYMQQPGRREQARQYQDAYYAKQENKEKRRKYAQEKHLMQNYGLTVEAKDEMAKKQQNVCLICGETRPLVVDHCHTTGRVRGLLCVSCNRGIGYLGDKPEILISAAQYLRVSP